MLQEQPLIGIGLSLLVLYKSPLLAASPIRTSEDMKSRKYQNEAECLQARREQKRLWAKDHAEHMRENLRKWRKENPERVRQLQAKNWAKNGENYNRKRRKANKDNASDRFTNP